MTNLNYFKEFLFIILTIFIVIDQSGAQIIFPTEETTYDDIRNFGACFTPNRERGLCINLIDCGDLFALLQKVPLYDDERLFLHKSQCGFVDKNVQICCPHRSIKPGVIVNRQSGTPTTTTTTVRPRNNLLPLYYPKCGGGLQERIYGGNVTKIDEFPWMALLEYTKPGNIKGFHCGGSLINSRYVITASHCVNGKAIPSDWRLTGVRLGEWDTSTDIDCEMKDCSDPVIDVPIERAIPHEQYNPNAKNQINDIALLRLSRNIPSTNWIKPICLPYASHLRFGDLDGTSLDVAGWGKTEKSSVSNLKLKARVDALNLQDCNGIYRRQGVSLVDSQVCAGGERGIDSCRGDSGGPLIGFDISGIPYYYLVGIVSFGPTPCGLEGWPGVYTKVSSYLDWIESHVEA